MFVSLKSENDIYDEKVLLLRLSALLRAVFHRTFSDLAIRAAGFSRGLFSFGYLPDSRAKDLRLILVQEGDLKEAAGDSGFKGTLPLTRKSRGVDTGYTTRGMFQLLILTVCLVFILKKINTKYILGIGISPSYQSEEYL